MNDGRVRENLRTISGADRSAVRYSPRESIMRMATASLTTAIYNGHRTHLNCK